MDCSAGGLRAAHPPPEKVSHDNPASVIVDMPPSAGRCCLHPVICRHGRGAAGACVYTDPQSHRVCNWRRRGERLGYPANAFSSNDVRTTVSVDGTISEALNCTSYGFSIPTGATIVGIEVMVERQSSSIANGGSRDSSLLLLGGTLAGSNLATATIYTPANVDVIEAHGSSTETWGNTWTTTQINATTFGAALRVTKPSGTGGAHTVRVDHVEITVHYTISTYYSRASTAWNTGTTWSAAGCGGASAGLTPDAGSNVVICSGHTVPLDTSTPSLGSLTIQGGGILNIGNSGTARTLTVAGNVDNSGTLQYATAANHAISIGGQFTNASGGTFTSAAVGGTRTLAVTGLISNAGTFRFAGTAAMTVTATGGITNSSIFDVSTLSNVTHTLNIAGDLTNSGTVQLAPDADSLVNTIFNGTTQAVGGTAGATFSNVTTTGTTVVTVSQPLAINGSLTLGAGTTFNAGALSHTIAGDFTNNGATFNASTGTVTFNSAGAQAIGGSAGTTFNNLTTASSAAVTVAQPLTISGNLTLGNATTFTAGASSHSIAGNLTNNGATFSSTGLFSFNGGSAQVIGGTTASTFNNLTINSAGVTLGVGATAGSVLTLTSGVVTTGANVLSVTGNCPGSVARTAGHVAGFLRLRVPAGSPTCVFPIGDAAGYRPVTAAFTTVSVAGDVTAVVTQGAGEHPNIGTSTIDPAIDVNRYWILANAGTTFASAVATFNYLAGDVDAGADQLAFVAGRYASGAWTYPASTFSANSAQVSGLTSATLAGDFVFGENTAPALFSHWRMDQAGGWNGTAGEVIDHGSGGFPGTAAGLTTRPTTSAASPAIAGSPGTCYYGVFNRSNKDYIALPAGYPNLAAAEGGFTIAGWINAGQQHAARATHIHR